MHTAACSSLFALDTALKYSKTEVWIAGGSRGANAAEAEGEDPMAAAMRLTKMFGWQSDTHSVVWELEIQKWREKWSSWGLEESPPFTFEWRVNCAPSAQGADGMNSCTLM
jgi:hypothetical protein